MNILIVSPSIVVDAPNQHRIVNYFRDKANVTIRFASGVIQSIWQIRDFKPEIIVIDWVLECPYIRNLIATIHGMRPDAALFHLDGDQLIASEKSGEALKLKTYQTGFSTSRRTRFWRGGHLSFPCRLPR